jgi:hypothetical protein
MTRSIHCLIETYAIFHRLVDGAVNKTSSGCLPFTWFTRFYLYSRLLAQGFSSELYIFLTDDLFTAFTMRLCPLVVGNQVSLGLTLSAVFALEACLCREP